MHEDYEYKLTELRTDYQEKLADIDKAYHDKDIALSKERAALERDLEDAREDVRLYGDEFDETIEYGMILPRHISAREEDLPELVRPHTPIPRATPIPGATPISLSEKNAEQPWDPMSPVHTFNEMPSIYYNLVHR